MIESKRGVMLEEFCKNEKNITRLLRDDEMALALKVYGLLPSMYSLTVRKFLRYPSLYSELEFQEVIHHSWPTVK